MTRFRLPVTRYLVLAIAVCSGQIVAAEKADLKVGDSAPAFECTADAGKTWKSSEHFGKKIVVLYFYPAALTGGCTKQSCGFRDDLKKLSGKNVEVVGISGDEVAGLKLFKQVHDLNFPLLADTDGAVAKKFGVPLRKGGQIERTIDGKTHVLKRGVTAARWTFVVNLDGKVALKNTKVKAAADSQNILKFVEKLSQ